MTLPLVAAERDAAPPFDAQRDAEPARRRPELLAKVREYLPTAAVLIAVAWWVLVAPRLWGGRGAGAVTGGALLTALALVAVRPDRVLPARVLGLALWLSAAAVLVAIVAPTGWKGAPSAANMISVTWLVVSVAAAVWRDRRVADVVILVVIVGVMLEFAESWLAWWGGEDPRAPITGTFYWWNPFAVYLLAGSVLGLAAWLRHRRGIAVLGLVAFALGSIGIVYSTSRAAGTCFALAAVIVIVAQLWRADLRQWGRVAAVAGTTSFAVWAVAGPPFFSHRGAPFAGTVARGATQTLSRNTGYRLEFWHEAFGVFERHPITGSGYHGLAAEAAGHIPKGWAVSAIAHNSYLGALSAGGLILGVPFLLGCALLAWMVLSELTAAVRRRDFSIRRFALPLVLGALMAHTAVDVDWSYPANFALSAILAGTMCGLRWVDRPRRATYSRLGTCAVLGGVALLLLGAYVARSGNLTLSLPVSHSAAAAVSVR